MSFQGLPTLARAHVHASMQISDRTSCVPQTSKTFERTSHYRKVQCEYVDPEQISIQFLSRYSTGSPQRHVDSKLIPMFTRSMPIQTILSDDVYFQPTQGYGNEILLHPTDNNKVPSNSALDPRDSSISIANPISNSLLLFAKFVQLTLMEKRKDRERKRMFSRFAKRGKIAIPSHK
ncbi:hypothetical protein PSENEW3n2_00000756 [Picochlorum sp. SENEW3]|nr:hypothetical protein PSENEW3n2_00000756 [Picochlorum sp. SENEW3]WPT15677.1 hypothetical protein PSENEW3_00000756 [Picochlorum sp. SENEW3]